MRIGVDCTPLLGRRTGVGMYTDGVLRELAAGPAASDSIIATAFSLRGHRDLAGELPDSVAATARPAPARALRWAWQRASLPPVEWLCGAVDVFHATNFVLPPLRRAAGVLTVHDLSFLRYAETVSADSLTYQQLVPRGLHQQPVVCTPSRAVADQVQDAYGVPDERLVVTHLGVDDRWYDAQPLDPAGRSALGLPASYVLAVGTLEPRKNLRLLVEAYEILLGRAADVPPLVVVGGEGWGPALDTSRLPAERVVRTGHLPIDELRGVVAGATAFAFPSLDEGFGLPPVEALACGVPVAASDLPVTREVLGSAAVLASKESPEAFADAVLAALAQSGFGSAARRAHARQYTWAACAATTYQAYLWALELTS